MNTGTGLAFGDLLRRHRDSAGLTQEDLAELTGLTPQAISLLERGERRRPHRYTVQKLAEALELEDEDLASFEAATRRPPARRATTEPARRDLPIPLTPLVGRDHEAATAAKLMSREDVRLVTMIGPGGVGKTRLALEVAGRAGEAFADGVAFVALAPLRDPDLIPSALAEALGITYTGDGPLLDVLKRHLRDRQMLLVLDNFEHLLSAATMVTDLMGACPGLTVLATSRAPLRLMGEHQLPVPPLSLPAGTTVDALARSPAVELFCQRARAVAPGFELTDAEAPTVAGICRRLDGLPLAIELAAARIKLFPPQAMLERLERGLRLPGGGARDLPERQRTLRDTVAWSYRLLDDAERLLFARLADFAGGCSLEAVEAVCGTDDLEPGDVLENLSSLVDNSLLVSRSEALVGGEDRGPRFMMLETIREYAAERLHSSDEKEQIHRAHALYYLSLAEAAQPEVSARTAKESTAILEGEHDNLRAALRWSIELREADIGARLGLALWRFWAERFHMDEGRRWLEAVLALGGGPEDGPEGRTGEADPTLPARRWAFLHLVAGILAAGQGDYDRAVTLFEESLALYRDLGHRKGTSGPLRELGAVAYQRGDYERAMLLSERALAVSREFGSTFGSGLATCTLADALRAQGDLERARELLEESLGSLRRHTYPLRVANALAITLSRLGSIECELGRDERASALFKESLGLARRFGFTFDGVISLEGLARVATVQGRPEKAARLLGASAARRDEMGTPLTPIARADHAHAVGAARATLGEDAFAAAWDEGYAAPFEETIADALDEA